MTHAAPALSRVLARLFDSQGEVAIPDFEADVAAPSAHSRERLEALTGEDAAFRADVGMVDSAELIGGGGTNLFERIW